MHWQTLWACLCIKLQIDLNKHFLRTKTRKTCFQQYSINVVEVMQIHSTSPDHFTPAGISMKMSVDGLPVTSGQVLDTPCPEIWHGQLHMYVSGLKENLCSCSHLKSQALNFGTRSMKYIVHSFQYLHRLSYVDTENYALCTSYSVFGTRSMKYIVHRLSYVDTV